MFSYSIKICGKFLVLGGSSVTLGLASLSGVLLLDQGRAGDGLVLLGDNDFHVAGVGHEGVDTTVGAVQAAADLGGGVDLDVADVQEISVQILAGSVDLSVLEEIQEELAGLLGPAGERAGHVLVLLGLGSAADSTDGATEWNCILVVQNTLQESLRLLKTHTTDRVSGGVRVLEVHAQIGALSLSRCTDANNWGTLSVLLIFFYPTTSNPLPLMGVSSLTDLTFGKSLFPLKNFFRPLRTLSGVGGELVNRRHCRFCFSTRFT